MKKILIICLIILTAILEVSAQYQASVLNATKNAVSMRCVGYGKKATIASMDAELSAIKTLLFVGAQNTQHSMPCLLYTSPSPRD